MIHILDLIMWPIIGAFIWFILDKAFNGEYTHEMGAILGIIVLAIYTVIYFALFVVIDHNWIDIFQWLVDYNYSNLFTW
jgi:hypothetical protein